MRRARGQAAVAAALTLPLAVFMMLGTLQLFALLQARILAQYAATRAARAGSVNFGSCKAMEQAAIAVLVPVLDRGFAREAPGVDQARAFWRAYDGSRDNTFEWPGRAAGTPATPVVWIDRRKPDFRGGGVAENEWSWPTAGGGLDFRHLEIRMVLWAPMQIPFANWLFARLALARWGLMDFTGVNPYAPADGTVTWSAESGALAVPGAVATELRRATLAKTYTFPVEVSAVVQMMSPPRWGPRQCWTGGAP
ncbi:MAG: pilus assembly protein [Myxococcaceae bacterium]|nr:pilus assembly protein [Myxococcaceae bacterium]